MKIKWRVSDYGSWLWEFAPFTSFVFWPQDLKKWWIGMREKLDE